MTTGWDRTTHDLAVEHLGLAADQVHDLLPFVTGEQQVEPAAVAVACKESFVLNVRLLADFLRGRQDRDVRPQDILPGWELNDEMSGRLRDWHDLTSKHAMHLSPRRFDDGEPLPAEAYRQMAADVLGAYESFLTAYRGTAS